MVAVNVLEIIAMIAQVLIGFVLRKYTVNPKHLFRRIKRNMYNNLINK